VLRRGSTEPLTLTLTTANTGRLSGDRFEAPTWGLAVKGITDQMVFDMDLIDKDGVFVEGVKTGGPAHRGGLNRGWVLGSVEGQPVHDLAGFRAIYEELGDGRPVLLTVGRYESQRYVLVKDERGDAP
jgi:S1-C subfamily serine protease